jgi:hypothetical protein
VTILLSNNVPVLRHLNQESKPNVEEFFNLGKIKSLYLKYTVIFVCRYQSPRLGTVGTVPILPLSVLKNILQGKIS